MLVLGWPSNFLLYALMLSLVIVNIGWSLFNLLPIWPLDGGHVVRDQSRGVYGYAR